MFDPRQHRLEVLYLALKRWKDELARIDAEPCLILQVWRRVEAMAMINRIDREIEEEMEDG